MTEADPIKVYARDGRWLVNYGSYVHGSYDTRSEAIKAAAAAALVEQRELTIEPEREVPVPGFTISTQAGGWIHWDA
jgi:hypothetical protein